MTIETITGIAASVCTAASLVPQLIKIVREKKAENVSLSMLLILFAGLGLWVYYGILKKDLIIIISNSFSFAVNLLLGIFSIKYKQKNNQI
jgi:MtN3 and saliva related transmembrane protein